MSIEIRYGIDTSGLARPRGSFVILLSFRCSTWPTGSVLVCSPSTGILSFLYYKSDAATQAYLLLPILYASFILIYDPS